MGEKSGEGGRGKGRRHWLKGRPAGGKVGGEAKMEAGDGNGEVT